MKPTCRIRLPSGAVVHLGPSESRVLDTIRSAGEEFLSGAKIADMLETSNMSIRVQVNNLRKKLMAAGESYYAIESNHRGFRWVGPDYAKEGDVK